MAYCYPNYPTKKLFKLAVNTGDKVTVKENTPYGQEQIANGMATIEGPHYPKPHKWYATCEVKDGIVMPGTVQ